MAGLRGLVHFSSVPTDMRPNEIRLVLQQFGRILRQKFVPFDRRRAFEGKSKLSAVQFKEGWVEFEECTDAKRAADTLNATMVQCKRFRRCRDQLWNVRYSPGMRWDHLLEQKEELTRDRKKKEYDAKMSERIANEEFRRICCGAQQKNVQRRKEVLIVDGQDGSSAPPIVRRRVGAKSARRTDS